MDFFQLYLNAPVTIASGVAINPIMWNLVDYDTAGVYNPVTGKISTPGPSVWLVSLAVDLNSLAATDTGELSSGIQTDQGVIHGRFSWGAHAEIRNAPEPFSPGELGLEIPACIVQLTGAGDAMAATVFNGLSARSIDMGGGYQGTRFTGIRIG